MHSWLETVYSLWWINLLNTFREERSFCLKVEAKRRNSSACQMWSDAPDLGTDQVRCKELRKKKNKAHKECRGYPISKISFVYEQQEAYSNKENVRKHFPKKIMHLGNSIVPGKTLTRNKFVLLMNIDLLLLLQNIQNGFSSILFSRFENEPRIFFPWLDVF